MTAQDVLTAEFTRQIITLAMGAILTLIGALVTTGLSSARARAEAQRERLFHLRRETYVEASKAWLRAEQIAYKGPWTHEKADQAVSEILDALGDARIAFGLDLTTEQANELFEALSDAINAHGESGFDEAHERVIDLVGKHLKEIRDAWRRELQVKRQSKYEKTRGG